MNEPEFNPYAAPVGEGSGRSRLGLWVGVVLAAFATIICGRAGYILARYEVSDETSTRSKILLIGSVAIFVAGVALVIRGLSRDSKRS